MVKTAEQELRTVLKVEGKITRANILDGGNAIEIFIVPNCSQDQSASKEASSFDERFPIVRASTLSKKDSFLKHKPQGKKQENLKKLILKGIDVGLSDFRRPAIDPSFDKDGNIIYKEGEKPAVGKSANFWNEELKKFMADKNSRMGTLLQYAAFLGLLIKYLIEEKGYKVAEAWKAVCDDSKELGHYWNSDDAKHAFEATGSRKIWVFYDLANTCKIVSDDSAASGFSLVGGTYFCNSFDYPLADVGTILDADYNFIYGVGWLVLDV